MLVIFIPISHISFSLVLFQTPYLSRELFGHFLYQASSFKCDAFCQICNFFLIFLFSSLFHCGVATWVRFQISSLFENFLDTFLNNLLLLLYVIANLTVYPLFSFPFLFFPLGDLYKFAPFFKFLLFLRLSIMTSFSKHFSFVFSFLFLLLNKDLLVLRIPFIFVYLLPFLSILPSILFFVNFD